MVHYSNLIRISVPHLAQCVVTQYSLPEMIMYEIDRFLHFSSVEWCFRENDTSA